MPNVFVTDRYFLHFRLKEEERFLFLCFLTLLFLLETMGMKETKPPTTVLGLVCRAQGKRGVDLLRVHKAQTPGVPASLHPRKNAM